MKFSVIIPVYNRAQLVKQAIDSVLAQIENPYEVIVVDDGSTDNTPQVLESYGDRIRLFHQHNEGPEIARQRGADEASGEYLVFLDSDDILLPWAIETYSRIVRATNNPALVVGTPLYFSSEDTFSAPADVQTPIEITCYEDFLSKDRPIAHIFSLFVVRKKALEIAGGFRKGCAFMFQGDDLDFLLRIGCQGPAVLIQQPPTVAYREHAGGSCTDFRTALEGFRINIEDEKKGRFPGGNSRRLDRHALIGGAAGFWSLKLLRMGYVGLGIKLFSMGFPMIMAKLLRELRVLRRGRSPVILLNGKDKHSPYL